MFHSRKGSHDIKRANSKFMDPRKDTHTRFRALKTLTDQLPLAEIKTIFQGFCVDIYYIFYEEFNALVSASKSKGHKSFKEELEGLLLILEKLLILVPERIYERWQFNSIGSILRRLLHHGNLLAVREIGVKLYLLWLQDLQENIDELGLLVYGSIIPGFPNPIDKIDCSKIYRPQKYTDSIYPCISGNGFVTLTTSASQYLSYLDIDSEWCNTEAIVPLLPPQQGEKNPSPDELTNKFLDRVLDYMTKKMMDVNWRDHKMRESGFFYLFQHFKKFYLPHIFPLWDPVDRLFIKSDEVLQTSVVDTRLQEGSQTQMNCRWRVLCWFVAFTVRFKKPNRRIEDNRLPESPVTEYPANNETYSVLPTEEKSIQVETLYVTAENVRSVLYATKDNVLCLHEVFRQGFLMPIAWSDIICRVLTVYNEWFKPSERPVFMLENLASEEPVVEQVNTLIPDDRSPLLRTSSYKEAVVNCDKGFFPRIPIEFVRAGLQANVRLFVTNSSHVFFSQTGLERLQQQVDVCRQVMKMYRSVVLELSLDEQTWKQLLVVLLRITEYTLKGRPPNPREKSLGGQLATYIFQTLFVTWIRASLQVNVPENLWNEMLRIISSLTSWHEMISEWAGTIDTLTRVLARTVYGIDTNDLPLERLTEQKRKKQRGRVAAISSNNTYSNRKSFSRGWSRYYKSDSEFDQNVDMSDREGNGTNVRDFVALLPRTASLSLNPNKDEMKTQSLRLIQSEGSLKTTTVDELPDVLSGEPGFQGTSERKRTLREVADDAPSYDDDPRSGVSSPNAPLLNAPIQGAVLDNAALDGEVKNILLGPKNISVEGAQSISAPLAAQEVSTSSDSSAEMDRASEANQDQIDGSKHHKYRERSSETESLLTDVLESADRIYSKHFQEKKSTSNVSISSEDSFASCTSFPYSDGIMKSDGSRSVTPSVASERLSRDDLDQFYTQPESSRSTNSLLETAQDTQTPDSTNQESTMSEMDSRSSLDTKPPDIIADHPSMSDPDLINFDSEVEIPSKPIGADSQSLDSAAFTLYEGDTVGSFKVPKGKALESAMILKSSGSFASSCSTLVGDRADVQQHVRFADDQRQDSNESSESVNTSEKSEFREREDTLIEQTEDRETQEEPSVIAGGKKEGWTPMSAIVLWRRMIGMLGNVNKIKDQDIHAKVFAHLIEIWSMLRTVRQNQGISLDNRSTPPQPRLIPPLLFPSTWCFEAMSLSRATDHKSGRMLAYKLMCLMTVRRHDKELSPEHLTHFYRLLHVGLTGSDQDVVNAVVSQCAEFYSYAFPGSTALIFDFIFAANSIISTQSLKHPRRDAVTLLGSLISLPNLYSEMKIYQPGTKIGDSESIICGKNLRENIVIPQLKAAKIDPSCHARCISLNSLGIFIIESLVNSDGHARITECLSVILTSLCFHNKVVSNVALDVIWSLIFYQEELNKFEALLPLKLLEGLCLTTLQLLLEMKQTSSDAVNDNTPEFISKIVLCVLDWAMSIPKDLLLSKRKDSFDCTTYLALVFKTFKRAHDGYPPSKYPETRRSLNINQIIAGDSRPIRLARVHDDVTETSEGQEGRETVEDRTQEVIAEKRKGLIKKTATYALSQLTNYLGHFPLNTGAVRPQSQVTENEDDTSGEDDLTPAIFDKDSLQFFLLNKTTLLSVVEINVTNEAKVDSQLQTYDKYSRFILRDMTGKYCWDHSVLYSDYTSEDETDMGSSLINWLRSSFHGNKLKQVGRSKSIDSGSPRLLAWDENTNVDRIDKMLHYIGNTSPECLLFPDQALNIPAPVPEQITTDIQSSVVTSVLKQHNMEQNYVHEIRDDERINAVKIKAPEVIGSTAPFHLSRYFVHQLGHLSWEKRQEVDLLKPTPGLVRELKNLDNRPCRETHKIAIFYVGPGQEDKMSIMSNTAGSKAFEEFVSGMAWEVDLATHSGFIGGLERNLSTGTSAPYFALHDLEVIFHVSTRMPLSEGESSIITKVRHLGNDEVHIVWSEHSRDFRRGIVNMEFGDVIIVIYPLRNNLFKIKIDKKLDVPLFGPLFDGAIVDGKLLPYLVRSTAINGGRAKRSTMPLYERHYEERGRYIDQISERHVEGTSFEVFAESVFNPCRACKNKSRDTEDGLAQRTFSVPSRPVTSSDPSAMMKLLDAQNDIRNHRNRASSAVDKTRERIVTSPLSSADDSAQELDNEKPRERKRSLSKRFKSGTRTFSAIDQDDPGTT